MPWLRAEMHTHSSDDPKDGYIAHSSRQLIDKAHAEGYDVLALTLHEKVLSGEKLAALQRYAKSRGIVLIAGCEARIGPKDVLLYNITEAERSDIRTFDDLRALKARRKRSGKDMLVVAPHPYFFFPAFSSALMGRLEENIDVFDAIEFSMFYNNLLNLNRKALAVAKRFRKPVVGNSDLHILSQIGYTYTLIDAERDPGSVIRAIKAGKVRLKTRPLPLWTFVKMFFKMI